MSRPFVYKLAWPNTTLWHFGGHLWTWKCPSCGGMGYMERDRISVFNRAAHHLCPDTTRPFVGRTRTGRSWYWQCDRCHRHHLYSAATHAETFQAAHDHATSGYHYINRYT